jgi:hypothetical protein
VHSGAQRATQRQHATQQCLQLLLLGRRSAIGGLQVSSTLL